MIQEMGFIGRPEEVRSQIMHRYSWYIPCKRYLTDDTHTSRVAQLAGSQMNREILSCLRLRMYLFVFFFYAISRL